MKNSKNGRSLRVGIVANEFFDSEIGPVGGFGRAARMAANVLNNDPNCNVTVRFLTAEQSLTNDDAEIRLDGIPLISLNGNRLKNILKLLPERIDVLLSIDYRSKYRGVFNALPFTPIITWVRDPRHQDDIDKVMTLRIPGKTNIKPAGIHATKSNELAKYRKRPFPLRNRVVLANKMPHMKETNEAVYNIPASDAVLPNPSVVDYDSVRVNKAKKPTVIFIGRLDPIKRPWLFIELARTFPDVEFLMLGKNHFNGEGSWAPENIPANVKLLGHVTGRDKFNLLSSAWVFVNTSIHEESPVSVLEALAYETPVISYGDWGRLVDRHGIAIGQHFGTGLDGMPDLRNALSLLLTDDELRRNYGKAGRQYVETEHNDEAFLKSFREICVKAGVTKTKNI